MSLLASSRCASRDLVEDIPAVTFRMPVAFPASTKKLVAISTDYAHGRQQLLLCGSAFIDIICGLRHEFPPQAQLNAVTIETFLHLPLNITVLLTEPNLGQHILCLHILENP